MDETNIPAISTNNKGHPFYRVAFVIGGDGVEASQHSLEEQVNLLRI